MSTEKVLASQDEGRAADWLKFCEYDEFQGALCLLARCVLILTERSFGFRIEMC